MGLDQQANKHTFIQGIRSIHNIIRIFFNKPWFLQLKTLVVKNRVWQTYPSYKNLVLEIPKLGIK